MTRIVVFGAGAIGAWIGGRLSAGGCDVTLIRRPRVLDELMSGLTTSELLGATRTAHPTLATDATAAATADLVLVTVKSAATEEAARELADKLGPKTIYVSLHNGVRNVPTLRAALPRRAVIAGMVPFNVIRKAPGHYHRASGGKVMFEAIDIAGTFSEACLRTNLPFELRDDMPGVQWAKLCMNLNNAIHALSGLPLAAELSQRAFRSCLALAQREAISMIGAAGEPQAKRPTEIDYINGEVVRLAAKVGRQAPINEALVTLIREAEQGGRRDFRGPELHAVLSRG